MRKWKGIRTTGNPPRHRRIGERRENGPISCDVHGLFCVVSHSVILTHPLESNTQAKVQEYYSYERTELIARFNQLGATSAGLNARLREREEEARRAAPRAGCDRESNWFELFRVISWSAFSALKTDPRNGMK